MSTCTVSDWSLLPTVVITEILKYLNLKDSFRCSTVCKNWRQCLYNPVLWKSLTLNITSTNSEKVRFFVDNFCKKIRNLRLIFDSKSDKAMREVCKCLTNCKTNKKLVALTLRMTSGYVEWPVNRLVHACDRFHGDLSSLINTSQCLKHLSLGFNEEICDLAMSLIPEIATTQSKNIQSLHLASVKGDSGNYGIVNFDANLFSGFSQLKYLSLDYDYLSDDLLFNIAQSNCQLLSLCLNVHGLLDKPGEQTVTDNGWKKLITRCSSLRVTINVLHNKNDLVGYNQIFHPSIPLVCYRQIFCSVEAGYIQLIGELYHETLESYYVIDETYSFIQLMPNSEMFSPLITRCSKLQHFTYIGHAIMAEDVKQLANQASNHLLTLVIPSECICYSVNENPSSADAELEQYVSNCLGRPWKLASLTDLPDAVKYEEENAEDAYINLLLDDIEWKDGPIVTGILGP